MGSRSRASSVKSVVNCAKRGDPFSGFPLPRNCCLIRHGHKSEPTEGDFPVKTLWPPTEPCGAEGDEHYQRYSHSPLLLLVLHQLSFNQRRPRIGTIGPSQPVAVQWTSNAIVSSIIIIIHNIRVTLINGVAPSPPPLSEEEEAGDDDDNNRNDTESKQDEW